LWKIHSECHHCSFRLCLYYPTRYCLWYKFYLTGSFFFSLHLISSKFTSNAFLALDRSTSILTSSTHIYREFISQFVNTYTFDPSSPSTSTQMGIVQYGIILFTLPHFQFCDFFGLSNLCKVILLIQSLRTSLSETMEVFLLRWTEQILKIQ
jgi:hypothetical protein